jgi:hypothetical protein
MVTWLDSWWTIIGRILDSSFLHISIWYHLPVPGFQNAKMIASYIDTIHRPIEMWALGASNTYTCLHPHLPCNQLTRWFWFIIQ